jgi:hypothetical protein
LIGLSVATTTGLIKIIVQAGFRRCSIRATLRGELSAGVPKARELKDSDDASGGPPRKIN